MARVRCVSLVAAVFASIAFGANSAIAAEPGDLDKSFSSDGVRTIDFGRWEIAQHAVVDDSGRISVFGRRGQAEPFQLALVRLLPGGAFDRAFSGDGKRIVDPARGDDASVAWRTRGGCIVVYGSLGAKGYYLMRFLPNGRTDRTFGNDGMVTGKFPSAASLGDMVILPSGRIIVAAVVRGDTLIKAHTWDGTSVQRFGGDGVAKIDGASWEIVHDASGRILVLGVRRETTLVVDALRANGTRDASYGQNGRGSLTIRARSGDELGNPIAELLADGDLAVATDIFREDFTTDLVVGRFTANGSASTSFGGGDGWRPFSVDEVDVPTTIAPLANGGMIVGGFASAGFFDGDGVDLLLVGFRPGGRTWNAFGTNGVVRTDFGVKGNVSASHAVVANEHLIVVGQARRDMLVARFEVE